MKSKNATACPVVQAMETVGTQWRLQILYALEESELRFNELKRATGGRSKTLSDALEVLTDEGLIIRRTEEAAPIAVYYELSEKGATLLNRLDDIVVFSALSTEDLGQIVEITIDRLQQRLSERRLELAVTPAARSWLADHGYDPTYGARPLRRLMQREIDDTLAKKLLSGEIHDGDTVKVDVSSESDGLDLTRFELEPVPNTEE